MKHLVLKTLVQAKRLVIIVIGFTILAVGIALIVLPGPAILIIPLGLTILATEFIWAKKLLTIVQERIARMRKGNGCQKKP